MRSSEPTRARWTVLVLPVAVVATAFGCAQIIGADDPRDLAPLSADGGLLDPNIDAFAPVPEAGDPNACPPNQKRCNGACVAKSDPSYGCGGASCEPCSVPNAQTVKCTVDGECAFGTCRPGFAACGAPTAGCLDNITSTATCGGCGTACAPPLDKCTPGGCAADCGALTNCSGSCVDLKTQPAHCGVCGNACKAGANGDPECANGSCVTLCRPGYGHCDGAPNGDCVPLKVFYRDADGDGVGDTAQTKLACDAAAAGAGWALAAGDCHDGNKDVHPGQKAFFAASYKDVKGNQSFDYDCDRVEAEQPGVAHFPGCNGSCVGAGIGPAGSGRSGGGVNDYCGSTRRYACAGDVVPVEQQQQQQLPQSVRPLAPAQTAQPGGCGILTSTVAANPCH